MEFKDYYKVLGVEPDADTKTIKTAYRKLARKFHPDMNSEQGAEEKFKEVAEAYQVLKNEQTRAEFDELRQYQSQSKQGFRPPPGWQSSHDGGFSSAQSEADFSEFFNSIFGGRGQAQHTSGFRQSGGSARGGDIEIELPVFLEETLKENQKTVEFVIPPDGGLSQSQGTKKNLSVKIPQGVVDGARIRLKGQGKPGLNGGTPGDLYLHIRVVPHPLFDVAGHNITITVPLAPWEAALGTKVTIPTLEGKINLTIPENSQSGDKLRVKGKGLPSKTTKGDLFAVLKVVMPDKTSENAKKLWQEMAKSEAFNPRDEWSIKS